MVDASPPTEKRVHAGWVERGSLVSRPLRRWCVLTAAPAAMTFYADDSETLIKGPAVSLEGREVSKKEDNHSIVIKASKSLVLKLILTDVKQADEWLKQLEAAVRSPTNLLIVSARHLAVARFRHDLPRLVCLRSPVARSQRVSVL